MHSFFDGIVKPEIVTNIYKELKEQSLPLYLYGAGSLADAVYRKLMQNGIPVVGILTDTGTEVFRGKKVDKFLDFINMQPSRSCNVMLGFASAYAHAKKGDLLKMAQFCHVYEIANPYDHHKHFNYTFVLDNREELGKAFGLLEDAYSRNCFFAFINSRISENVDYVRDVFAEEFDEFNNEIVQCDFPRQIFLDIGAYQGAGIARFVESCKGRYKRIIGIEPNQQNYKELERFCVESRFENITLHCIGCWKEKDTLHFNTDSECSRIDEEASSCIEVDTIDHICKDDIGISIINVGTATFVEEIVLGAKDIIQRDRPILRIFMGGAKEELYRIPQLIKQLDPSYRLYLRFAQAMPSRFYLYAVPEK